MIKNYKSMKKFSPVPIPIQLYEAFLHGCPIASAIVAENGTFLDVNQKYCDILGYSKIEMLNLTYQDITHQNDLVTDTMMAGFKEPYAMIKTYVSKDGTKIVIRLHVTPVFDTEKNFLYYAVWASPIDYPSRKFTRFVFWMLGVFVTIETIGLIIISIL